MNEEKSVDVELDEFDRMQLELPVECPRCLEDALPKVRYTQRYYYDEEDKAFPSIKVPYLSMSCRRCGAFQYAMHTHDYVEPDAT